MKSKKYKVKRSGAGLGLFAQDEIGKGEFIIEYKGKLLNQRQTDEKGGKYLFAINSRKTIDGTTRKNIARYINHSCKPNAEVEIKKGRIMIYARKKITPEEEICYDYGKEYFNEHIKPFGCVCEKCKILKKVKKR